MADGGYDSELSEHTHSWISLRGKNLATDVLGEMQFPAAMYYLWTGREPTAAEATVLDAMLSSLMVHGKTPSAIAARMTAHTEPDTIQAAVASGILGVGSRYVGTMKECAEELQRVQATTYRDREIDQLVQWYRDNGQQFPGFGHPHLAPVDPRAERLFEIGFTEGVADEHVKILQSIQTEFEAETQGNVLINVTGAIAALGLDIGLSPKGLRGVAVISRAAGVTGEVLEEEWRPIAGDIWEDVDRQTYAPSRHRADNRQGTQGGHGGQGNQGGHGNQGTQSGHGGQGTQGGHGNQGTQGGHGGQGHQGGQGNRGTQGGRGDEDGRSGR